MLFDFLAYAIAFSAAYITSTYQKETHPQYSIHRLEPLAAFINGILLVPLVGFILWESYNRFISPTAINTQATIALATVGLIINIISVLVINHDNMSLNEKERFITFLEIQQVVLQCLSPLLLYISLDLDLLTH